MISDARLKYLYMSARLGTMRAASDELDVAASSISRQISAFEKELGVPLIEKGSRRIKLTESGELVCQYYREKCSNDEVLFSKIEDIKSLKTGKVILAVGEAFITQHFSDLVIKFMDSNPGLKIIVQVANTNDVISMVQDDEAHFGLIFDTPKAPDIRVRLTLPQPLKCIVGINHPFYRKKSLNLSELTSERIGLPIEGYRIRQIIHNAEQEEGIFLESFLSSNSLSLITNFIKLGQGISILPELVIQNEILSGKLKSIPINNDILNATKTSLITRVSRQLPTGAYRFMLNIEKYLKSTI
jgi:DNA-binding transcriptional LysR family regulator